MEFVFQKNNVNKSENKMVLTEFVFQKTHEVNKIIPLFS